MSATIKNTFRAYDGFFKIDQVTLSHTRPDGTETGNYTREIFERGHCIAVIPYDPVKKTVVLIEQLRVPAVIEGHPTGMMIEIPSGMIDEGEKPFDAVIRELEEETKLRPKYIEKVGKFYTSVGGSTETVIIYYAEVDTTNLAEYGGLEEEQEDIHIFSVNVDIAQNMLETGQIQSMATAYGLSWLANKVK